ncbi:MAG: SpoIIE family protein phosphatase [Acidobacteria bacterium]|nr:SpoIIE family protein phosphatase [Acidobacteriota bacterium]
MSAPGPSGVARVPSSTILVVDDSPVNLQVLVRTLHASGHRLLAATSGRAALDIAERARPDLILLDVMMPDMDGFEVCRALKSRPETQESVVIFLSALGEVSDKVSGLSIGAADYITKPIQAEEVLARVANHLTRQYLERELRRSRDRLDRELAAAADMQRRLLPRTMPADAGAAFAAFYQTSRHAGGDYYDVIALGGRRFGVMVADVSGHGAPAAIVMAMIRAVLHTFPGVPDDPLAVLTHINRHFDFLWDTAMFATAVYGVLDVERRTWRAVSAGHPTPLLIRPGREVVPAAGGSAMMLLFRDLGNVECPEQRLEPGDRLVVYTDGITDRQAPNGTLFDQDRLTTSLARSAASSPEAIVSAVMTDLERFAGGREADDDQTLVVMGLGPGAPGT